MYYFLDYQNDVLAEYRKRRKEGTLPLLLASPTPANLKKESLAVCQSRFQKSDLGVLTSFFGKAEDQSGMVQLIRKHDRDRFKPLQNFLIRDTGTPSPQIVELLAWLLDFTPRPHTGDTKREIKEDSSILEEEQGKKIVIVSEETHTPSTRVVHADNEAKVQTVKSETFEGPMLVAPTSQRGRRKTMAMAIASVSLLALGTMGIWYKYSGTHNSVVYNSAGPQSCMYWAGDHFQAVNCNQKMGDTLVVAMDSARLTGFRKITQTDTVSEQSIGHIWYAKVDGVVELYTADGNHPEKPYLRLRPLTPYMLNKYFRK